MPFSWQSHEIYLGDGDDRVAARNGLPNDFILCGPGADTATVDPDDSVYDCEQVNSLPAN